MISSTVLQDLNWTAMRPKRHALLFEAVNIAELWL
jgi:hypothetical protein